jgi:hypothetical protein
MNNPKAHIEKAARAFTIDPSTLEPLVGNSGARVLKILSVHNVESFGGKQSVVEGLRYQEGLAKQMTGDVALPGPLRSERGELGEAVETDDGLRIAIAFEFVPGKVVHHRVDGYQIPMNDPEVGGHSLSV